MSGLIETEPGPEPRYLSSFPPETAPYGFCQCRPSDDFCQ